MLTSLRKQFRRKMEVIIMKVFSKKPIEEIKNRNAMKTTLDHLILVLFIGMVTLIFSKEPFILSKPPILAIIWLHWWWRCSPKDHRYLESFTLFFFVSLFVLAMDGINWTIYYWLSMYISFGALSVFIFIRATNTPE